MGPEIATDTLHPLNNAIATALQNGARPEDISRLVNAASEKLRRNNGAAPNGAAPKKSPQETRVRSKHAFRLVLIIVSLAIAVGNVFVSSSYTSSAAMNLREERASQQPQVVHKNMSLSSNSSLAHEKTHLDFERIVLNNTTEAQHPCPFDVFFHDDCIMEDGGTTCIFKNVVLKKIEKEYLDQEFEAFERLTDTRYFPKLYYADKGCRTILQENVRPRGEIQNMWCSSYEYYKNFYFSVFKIFMEKNVIPVDLNVCCNTIVNDDHIRIIDFGLYETDKPPGEVHRTNRKMLGELLKDLDQIMKDEHYLCEDRERERSKKSRVNATARD